MRACRVLHIGLLAACVVAVSTAPAGETRASVESGQEPSPIVAYEIAVINKSMTGDWRDEGSFQKHVKEVFGVAKVLRFRLGGDPLQDWLDEEKPPVAKVICLIDGWVGPGMTRVDVRGFHQGRPLKLTIEVEGEDWKAALAQAKRYVEGSDDG